MLFFYLKLLYVIISVLVYSFNIVVIAGELMTPAQLREAAATLKQAGGTAQDVACLSNGGYPVRTAQSTSFASNPLQHSVSWQIGDGGCANQDSAKTLLPYLRKDRSGVPYFLINQAQTVNSGLTGSGQTTEKARSNGLPVITTRLNTPPDVTVQVQR